MSFLTLKYGKGISKLSDTINNAIHEKQIKFNRLDIGLLRVMQCSRKKITIICELLIIDTCD